MTNTLQKDLYFNPFPGLRPFGVDESYLYFGREGQSDEVLSILEKNRFVNILGSSGTGKSSLMFSGVIPTLHAGFINKAGNNWEVITAKPGLDPIKNLANGFKNHLEASNPHKKFSKVESLINNNLFEAILRKSTKGLSELYELNEHLQGKNLLIYIDQFEEIFRFRKLGAIQHLNESLAYVNLILQAVEQSDVPIYVALSMRSDFLGDCEQFPELTNRINDSHYLIPQMTREQKKLVITGPVAVGEGEISNRLVQRLLNDMGDRPDQLPVLQHALMRTWDYWITSDAKSGEIIDFIHYEAIGGVNEALSRHADEAFYELNEEQKLICEKIFKTITEKRSDNDGIRRPTPLNDIAQIVDEEESTLVPIIEKFRIKGRALLTPRENQVINSNSVIDISHEALMRVWYRLRNWVQEESESSQIYIRLAIAAKKYQQGNGNLWRPPDLQLAIVWRNKTKPTLKWALQYDNAFESVITFLERSENAYKKEIETKEVLQKKRLKRSKLVAYVLGTAAVFSLILLFFAFQQSTIAERQKEIAEESSERARKSAEVANENEIRAQIQKSEANKSAYRANTEKRNAEYNFLIAQEERNLARAATEESERNEQKALEAQIIAQEANNEAIEKNEQLQVSQKTTQAFRMRALAQKLAVKSQQQQEDDSLKALLAYYGYKFNINNAGYDSDNDIYNGLFYAVKALDKSYFDAFKSSSTDVRSLQFVKGRYLYTTGTSGRINAWEVENKSSNRSIVIFDQQGVFVKKIFVDNNNQKLVALTDGPEFYVINVGNRIRTTEKYTLPNAYAFDVVFRENSSDFLISSSDSIIYQFKNKALSPLLKIDSRIYDMELLNNDLLITGNNKGEIELWSLEDKTLYKKINKTTNRYIHSLAIGNKMIAAGDNSGLVTLYPLDEDFNPGEPITLRGTDGEIMTDLSFNISENQIIASSSKGTIRLWDLNNIDEFPMIINEPGSWVNAIALLNNSYIFAGCKDQVFRLYPIKSTILAESLQGMLKRDITKEEWDRYIGDEIEYNPILHESVFVNYIR
ncbi:High-affnity carbon uptake protein Hat/HatR [Marivirga sp. S37H4]|uniref:High-affnity carbon uptake protein Hat/HatR n=1 Tax=Marivirga aurantiaca TaxID=2802615 RepID=A0A934X0S4_9BACT|nr:High-affnity carbon uptake protein Hat/HatR [Marivirga aurantiaca]MBK6266236.1 High-affnity carbon uptake protein Hat/HatR [Marivirga aurantiaca]